MPKNIAMDGISCAKSYLDIVFQTFCEHKIVILHYPIAINPWNTEYIIISL